MPAETLYEGPAHEATLYLPSAGVVRFGFSDPRAGFVRSATGLWRGSSQEHDCTYRPDNMF
jgi:hypothetical protein